MLDPFDNAPVLEIVNLTNSSLTRTTKIQAVMGCSVSHQPDEIVGFVGGSGGSKSTAVFDVMQDFGKGGITAEALKFKGQDLAQMTGKVLRSIWGNLSIAILKKSMDSLSLLLRIGRHLMGFPPIHNDIYSGAVYGRTLELVADVKLPDPERTLRCYVQQLPVGTGDGE